jgi:hypothetical protein
MIDKHRAYVLFIWLLHWTVIQLGEDQVIFEASKLPVLFGIQDNIVRLFVRSWTMAQLGTSANDCGNANAQRPVRNLSKLVISKSSCANTAIKWSLKALFVR